VIRRGLGGFIVDSPMSQFMEKCVSMIAA
jgi:hypothetical protein